MIAGSIGHGFVTAGTVGFTLIAAVTLGSNYMVEDHGERVITGLRSKCVGVTSLRPDSKFYLGLGAFAAWRTTAC